MTSNTRIGYARVSTEDQNLDLQRDALTKAGCAQIYQEKVSGKARERIAPNGHNASKHCAPEIRWWSGGSTG